MSGLGYFERLELILDSELFSFELRDVQATTPGVQQFFFDFGL